MTAYRSEVMINTQKLLNLLFGFQSQRETALKILEFIKANQTAKPEDLRKLELSKKRFYTVMSKLKDIGLVRISRGKDKKVFYTLRADYFKEKFNDLIKDVVKELQI